VAEERAYFALRMSDHGRPASVVRLDEGRTPIGRSQRENKVVIPDERVSLHHAELVVAGPVVRLRDLMSTNGTWLRHPETNEMSEPRALEPNVAVALSPGDEIRLGGPDGPALTLEFEPIVLERIETPGPLISPEDPPRLSFLMRLLERVDVSGLLEGLAAILFDTFREPQNVFVWGEEGETPLLVARRVSASSSGGQAAARSDTRSLRARGFVLARAPLPFSRTVLQHVRARGETVVFGTRLPVELDVASLHAARILSGFCAPLMDGEGRVVGVFQADGRQAVFVPDRAQLAEVARLGRLAGGIFASALQADEAKRSAQRLERDLESLRRELGERARLQGIVGRHPAIARQMELAARVSALATPVLITGETGTGKDLFARAIHAASPRAQGPFLGVNCAELPPALAESELFGHERGAFTGADRSQPGLFERAQGGTLFLDEVGEASLAVQAMLLRTIERNEVRRIGSREYKTVDVRVIAATNRDLEAEVAKGTFRRDLYFRLNVVPLRLPPLRERREDVPELVEHVLQDLRFRLGRPGLRVSPEALRVLVLDPWPGNVRELENRLLRATVLGDSDELGPDLVRPPGQTGTPVASELDAALELRPLREARDEFIRSHLRRALELTRGNRRDAARLLQVDPSNLARVMRRLGLDATGPVDASSTADEEFEPL
jgi:transcriptional regulator with GAF, ATPase, and Fis domain